MYQVEETGRVAGDKNEHLKHTIFHLVQSVLKREIRQLHLALDLLVCGHSSPSLHRQRRSAFVRDTFTLLTNPPVTAFGAMLSS